MNDVLIECPRCGTGVGLTRARLAQRLARARCPSCANTWISRFPLRGAVEAPFPRLTDTSTFEGNFGVAPESMRLRATSQRRSTTEVRTSVQPVVGPVMAVRRTVRTVAVALSLVLWCSFALAKRDWIVRLLPATSGLYAAIGLPANSLGLEFRDVKSVLAEENSQRILLVDGKIANIRAGANVLPDLRVSVHTETGREVYHWDSPAPKKQLSGGETIEFRARLIASPEEGREIKVQFARVAGVPVAAANAAKSTK